MYLRHRPWTRKETFRFSLAVTVVPWAVLAVALRLLITGPIQLEMGLLGAGFLAILFTLLTALSVWMFAALSGLEIPDYFRLLRAVLWTAVAVSFLNVFAVHLFPLNLIAVTALQTWILFRKIPVWIQDPIEEAARIEPIAFGAVGIKAAIVASLFFFALVVA
jgi:hypothetical protein